MSGRVVLRTERLVLRELDEADAPFIVALLTDPDFVRHIGDRGVRTEADVPAYLARGPAGSYARHGFGLWAVTRKEDGVAIGMCGLVKRDGLDDVDLGYAFLPAGRGRGYAAEAARAVCDHAFRVVGLPRLVAIVSPGNAASVRVLEGAGFRYERMHRLPGEDHDVALYVLEPTVP